MDSFYRFSEAVHAVLNYIKQERAAKRGFAPHKLTYRFGRTITKHGRDLPDLSKLSNDELHPLRRYWQYVIDLVTSAQDAWIEPELENGRRPDLVLFHEDVVYVIELKTVTREIGQAYSTAQKQRRIHEQVFESAQLVRALTNKPVEAYVIIFLNRMSPQWYQVGERID